MHLQPLCVHPSFVHPDTLLLSHLAAFTYLAHITALHYRCLTHTMPSHAQSSTTLDEKYAAAHLAALNHIKSSRSRKSSKKHSHDQKPTTSSPQYDDFVLFPNSDANASETTRQQQSPNKDRQRTDRKGTPSATHLAATTRDPSPPKIDSSRRNRTPRHGGFKIVNLLEESEGNGAPGRRGEGKTIPPPAPEPPTLDSPDISDVDDEVFWGSSGGDEGKKGGKAA